MTDQTTPPTDRGAPRFAPAEVEVEQLPQGGMILRSPLALGDVPRCLGQLLEDQAARNPDRTFIAERDAQGGWWEVSYVQAVMYARTIGQALLARGLGPERPVMILSDNGVDHALLALGAMHVGVPVVPVSVAYSRMSQDFAKLRYIRELVQPGLVFADDGAGYAPALTALGQGDAEFVVSANRPADLPTTLFTALTALSPGKAAHDAYDAVGPDTVAKILFTSGSTGEPKGVINTQRMLTSNQEAIRTLWPFIAERPPVLVDWLPWNHTFGGNHDFNLVLRNGGTLYIDEGKPIPGIIERTVANLRAVSPTVYFNVPRGFAMLLDHLERDAKLAESFFRDLDAIFYAGAALPQSLWERLEACSMKALGRKVPMLSSWGTTETAPMATSVHYPIDRAGNVGLPAPGTEVKLVPDHDKLEIRVRGPNVTPGYWRRPDLTEVAFDEDGFYRPGDAMRLADPDDPAKGIVFDGRIAENFKLLSGTWVYVGALRLDAISAGAPMILDCVVTGHDRDEVGLLVFPAVSACRALCPQLPADAPLATVFAQPVVRDALAQALARHNRSAGGSSHRISRALILAEPPTIDRGEITDKGYINQRAVLANRKDLVARLYAEPPAPEVILVQGARR